MQERKSSDSGVKPLFDRAPNMSRLLYTTKLSADECLQRLQARSQERLSISAWSLPERGSVFVKVRANRFRLFAQGHKYVRNSFVLFFYGRVEESGDGARIIGVFRMHPLVRVFLLIWFGGLAIMSVVFPFVAFSGKVQAGEPPVIFVVAPLLMILLGVGLVSFGRWLSRGQVSRLRQFLSEELKATLVGKAGFSDFRQSSPLMSC